MANYNRRRSAKVQTYGSHFYMLRMESGLQTSGFLVPVPPHLSRDALYNDIIASSFRWHLQAIAYYRLENGDARRGWCDLATNQAFRAQGQELVPYMKHVTDGARIEHAGLGQPYDMALIMRAFSKGKPSMKPILKRHALVLNLTDNEISGIKPIE